MNSRMPVQIEAHNLSIHVSASPCKPILDCISLRIPSGSLTAILGESGSGKTSLLNVLSGRMQKSNLLVEGNVTYNNQDHRSIPSAYLVQQDILPETLTVRETLRYAAALRLDACIQHERDTVVEDVMFKLGLTRCADTRIGSEKTKGCSGGEKRRTLSKLARDGMTVVISVHSPRSDAWKLFDHVVLLTEGCLLYDGSSKAARKHFDQCGYPMPAYVNPADFFIDTIAVDSQSDECETQSLARIQHLRACWDKAPRPAVRPSEIQCPFQYEDQGEGLSGLSAILHQVKVMSHRTFTMSIRDRTSLLTTWSAVAGIAAINGWIFWQLDESTRGIQSRQGSLWAATGLYGFLILVKEICRLVGEIRLFDLERREKIINAGVFLLSRRMARLILEDLSLPTLFTIIYYPMVGYRGEAPQIFIFWAVMVLTHYIAIGFATICIAFTRSLHGAGLMGCIFFTLQMLASAYFFPKDHIPVYVRWLTWLTHTFYTFGALCENEFIGVHGGPDGHFYDCPYSKDPSDPRCKEYTGRYIVDNLALPGNWIWRPLVILCGIAVVFHLVAFIILRYNVTPSDSNRGEKRTRPHHARRGMHESFLSKSTHEVTIHLTNYYLQTKMARSLTGRLRPSKTVFGPLSTTFQPGQLNVIMGASGSGKTSLLLSISQRLSSRFRLQGSMSINGVELSKQDAKSIISYVPQDDNALMPALTVQETLFFAALLKLPTTMTSHEKQAQAEEVLDRFGLRSCANTRVGDEFVRGISGGEKRRLSIACEYICMPDVLILDEPTSGLDSSTASSVIKALHELAGSGRTVILSIHQPTSSIWPYLSRCLLLAPDGLPVYSGATSDMPSYFSEAGFECPTTMNPADFVLDLVTPDLEDEEADLASRTRIQDIIDRWASREATEYMPCILPQSEEKLITPNSFLDRPSFLSVFPLLLQRAALNLSRQPISIFARSVQVPGMAGMLTLFVAPFQNDDHSVQGRMGFIQQFCTLAFIGMIQNVATFPPERDIFYRESSDGLYSAEAFLLQYTILELPFELFSAVVFGVIAAFAAKLQPTPHMFGILLLSSFCTLNAGESMSMVSSILTSHLDLAVSLTCVVLAVFTVLGGTMSLYAPRVLQWVNHLSPIKYAIANVAIFSMRDREFTCDQSQWGPDGKCPIATGKDVLGLYNLDRNNPWLEVLGVALCAVGYRLLAYVLLRIRTSQWKSLGIRGVGQRIMRWMR